MLQVVIRNRNNEYVIVREAPVRELDAYNLREAFLNIARTLRERGYAVGVMDTDAERFVSF